MASDRPSGSLPDGKPILGTEHDTSVPESPPKRPISTTVHPVSNGQDHSERQPMSETEMNPQHSNPNTNIDEASDTDLIDLPEFGWEDLLDEYADAIQAATDKEKELLKTSQQLSEMFSAWATAASRYDNLRAWKRIKTRERYVELAEDQLGTKRAHYTQVVDAFQRALQLLQ